MEMTRLAITGSAIDRAALEDWVADPAHGAQVAFYGVVRNHNLGREVLGVSYDVYEPLALSVFRELCATAAGRWGKVKIAIVHRRGRLLIGEDSIAILVSTPHRDEAYQASRFLIEEIKHRAPIWKQEHYVGGDSEWVQGHALCGKH